MTLEQLNTALQAIAVLIALAELFLYIRDRKNKN